jgi:hypothetical protein
MTLPSLFPSTRSVRPPGFSSGAILLLLITACPARSAEARTFDRVKLLEEKGATSASVSLGDIDRDGDLDIILARGRHWPLDTSFCATTGRATSPRANCRQKRIGLTRRRWPIWTATVRWIWS